jgi:putative CocE/NonD family hydrolase
VTGSGQISGPQSGVRIRHEFPHRVRQIDNAWIPLPDGARLAARLWLPESASETPVPAIFEYIPYRKGDLYAVADSTRHPYFAGHGYACVRVDIRGSGDSDGVLRDEYHPQEQEDAVAVISWIAEQPWCSGDVGMIGRSWGGFNSLQVAARRPPQLKAIITICSTDDRYADDVHYIGGCVLSANMLSWASMMLAFNARPPNPWTAPNWRQIWHERLTTSEPLIEAWLTHQRRDDYWKHGSVCEDYAAIECPVYAVGGWVDGYPSAVLRLAEHLRVPRKALVGPWSHDWPQDGVPGPAIGFLQEALRWWDYWLNGIDTKIMDEPMLRVWMQDAVEPRPHYEVRPGRWVSEASWPSSRIGNRKFYCANYDDLLDAETGTRAELTIRGLDHTGVDAGEWCAWGGWGGHDNLPPDQRGDDGRSLCFTSSPLTDELEILGFPTAALRVRADRPNALIVARLCDVHPSGASTLVTRGVLNLTHRNGHEQPEPLVPGRDYDVEVRMRAIGYIVPGGHRLRLALSPTYWPWCWPSPESVNLVVSTAGSRLEIPVRRPSDGDEALPAFAPPEIAEPLPVEILRPGGGRHVRRDVGSGRTEIVVSIDQLWDRRFPMLGLETIESGSDTYSIVDGDPLSATVVCERTVGASRDRWSTVIKTESRMSATATAFRVECALRAWEGDVEAVARSWSFLIPRDYV